MVLGHHDNRIPTFPQHFSAWPRRSLRHRHVYPRPAAHRGLSDPIADEEENRCLSDLPDRSHVRLHVTPNNPCEDN